MQSVSFETKINISFMKKEHVCYRNNAHCIRVYLLMSYMDVLGSVDGDANGIIFAYMFLVQ